MNSETVQCTFCGALVPASGAEREKVSWAPARIKKGSGSNSGHSEQRYTGRVRCSRCRIEQMGRGEAVPLSEATS